MGYYDKVFDALGWREWCDADKTGGATSMADLLAKAKGGKVDTAWWDIPFPSLDNLHKSCDALSRATDGCA